MNLSSQIAKHFREVHFGKNWTASSMKDQLAGITWEQATTKVDSLNTIAGLVYHINYYVVAITKVLEGGPLDAKDKYSFDHPPVQSQEQWEQLLDKIWADAEKLAGLIEQIPDTKWNEVFVDEKYGSYYRNLIGVTEHAHYHLGQIVLLRKILDKKS